MGPDDMTILLNKKVSNEEIYPKLDESFVKTREIDILQNPCDRHQTEKGNEFQQHACNGSI